jgi:arylsulfatase A-like enzyme
LTSLYPSTHGIKDTPDRIPASVTTLAETYHQAGYATFATSSVPFTGKLTNLHQGVEVLHESTSVERDDRYRSKTARTFVDRLLSWVEEHRDVPFFSTLHVFDPHSPFEPYRPYDTLWMDDDRAAEHRENMETIKEFIDSDFMKRQSLPDQEEMDASPIDAAAYLQAERDWYDASIRAMDVEIGRLVERLEELGLTDKILIAFISDHGEEFLEHGKHFHGNNTYGEMINVPLMLWGPGTIPAGLVIDETVQSIDLMPTLLQLSRLPAPPEIQGRSLVRLMADGGNASAGGWRARPAFAERHIAPSDTRMEREEEEVESMAMVSEGWKLIRNTERPEGWPEFELYDHRADPLNLEDVAADHPEVVERLAAELATWHEKALAAQVEPDESAEGLSPEQIERLRSLGYLQ